MKRGFLITRGRLVLAAGLVWCLGCAPGSGSDGDELRRLDEATTRLAQKVFPAVVGLQCRGYYGTGVLIAKDGKVLTNITVIPADAADIRICTHEGKTYEGKILEANPKTEGVVLEIVGERKDFPYLPLGDSSPIQRGDTVFTLNRAFVRQMRLVGGRLVPALAPDDSASMSRGVVSGVYQVKSADEQSKYEGLVIETNAAINPGDDGGALVTAAGHVVGVISLAYASVRKVGTCIPVHIMAQEMKSLTGFLPAAGQRRLGAEAELAIVARQLEKVVCLIEVDRSQEPQPKLPDWRAPGLEPLARQRLRMMELFARPRGEPVSGFCLDREGHLLTSYWNVRGQNLGQIKVKLAEEDQWREAKLLAHDDTTDLALLKIAGPVKHHVAVSPSTGLKLGTFVGVLGLHQGCSSPTLTTGIVSATWRHEGAAFQLDALINYGNSGGPVINLEGQVVGLAGFVEPAAPWGLNSGVGLAVSGNHILKVLPKLKKGENWKRPPVPFLGVGSDLSRPEFDGAKVNEVIKGAAAEKAGLKPTDLITEVDGVKVYEGTDLIREIRRRQVGDQVKLKVIREGKEFFLELSLGARPEKLE